MPARLRPAAPSLLSRLGRVEEKELRDAAACKARPAAPSLLSRLGRVEEKELRDAAACKASKDPGRVVSGSIGYVALSPAG